MIANWHGQTTTSSLPWISPHKLAFAAQISFGYGIDPFSKRVCCFALAPPLACISTGIVLPGVALRTKPQYIARFQLQRVQSIWCQLWDVMNKFWWVVPTAHECLVTNVCVQKVSRSYCVNYCLDCSREKMCGFFSVCKPDLLSALLVSVYAYVCAYFSFL